MQSYKVALTNNDEYAKMEDMLNQKEWQFVKYEEESVNGFGISVCGKMILFTDMRRE